MKVFFSLLNCVEEAVSRIAVAPLLLLSEHLESTHWLRVNLDTGCSHSAWVVYKQLLQWASAASTSDLVEMMSFVVSWSWVPPAPAAESPEDL